MSKKYKLIKEYPGSLSVGTIYVESIEKDIFVHESRTDCPRFTIRYLSNPEFWEEIKCDILMHTTEDGVSIYKLKHPRLYWVQLKNFNMGIDYENSLSDIDTKNYKYFSTEKAAKEWAEMNKPKSLFKTTDGVDVFIGDKIVYVDDCFELYIDHIVRESVKIYDYCFLDKKRRKNLLI